MFAQDVDRPGFSGVLADLEPQAVRGDATEAPGSRAPVAICHGPVDPANRAAVAAFRTWLDDQREAVAS